MPSGQARQGSSAPPLWLVSVCAPTPQKVATGQSPPIERAAAAVVRMLTTTLTKKMGPTKIKVAKMAATRELSPNPAASEVAAARMSCSASRIR